MRHNLEVLNDFLKLLNKIRPKNMITDLRKQTIIERLKKHKLWLDSNNKEGVQFKATKENFTGFDFSHRDLRDSIFISCNLDYCNFYNTSLGKGTQLFKCSIKNSIVISAKLENTQFVECEIENTIFRSSNFMSATITGIRNKESIPTTSNDFSYCLFEDTTFNFFNFSGSKIREAKFNDIRFNECNLSMMDFTTTFINSSLSVNECKCIGIVLTSLFIEGSSFTNCDLTDAKFKNSIAGNTDFSGSNLTGVNFNNAALENCNFNSTLGSKMNFHNANMTGSKMRNSSFREAVFHGCNLSKADLSGSNLYLALINQKTIKNLANFSGCIWFDGRRCKANSIGICY